MHRPLPSPPPAGTLPRKGYAICGEPRSGSTYLARVLESTGVLGKPFEFFRSARDAALAEARADEALHDLAVRASSANGVYGFKIFAGQFDLAERTDWAERLPDLRFIHLERLDLLGQAISRVRTEQTGSFGRDEAPARPARYDRDEIARMIDRTAANQSRWRIWFARNGIVPLRLTYEQVVADPAEAARAVARHLELEMEAEPDLARVTIGMVRGAESEEWRRRFVEESADRSRLDHPLGRLPILLRRLRSRIRGAG